MRPYQTKNRNSINGHTKPVASTSDQLDKDITVGQTIFTEIVGRGEYHVEKLINRNNNLVTISLNDNVNMINDTCIS
jgi:hypothetical protein